ncbi:hypothetical protein ACIBP6_05190 [Nonomuraea terrae]|uniref:hypothetical protein n=1 Tax=Nonomuraea terrae TaxID=2530383 RepID=UPI0037AD9A43
MVRDMVHYGVTQTAQPAPSRGQAQEVAGTGVTVNSVLPGPALGDGVRQMGESLYPGLDPEEQERRFVAEGRPAGSPLGRLIRPAEVASLIAYAVSDPGRRHHRGHHRGGTERRRRPDPDDRPLSQEPG